MHIILVDRLFICADVLPLASVAVGGLGGANTQSVHQHCLSISQMCLSLPRLHLNLLLFLSLPLIPFHQGL